MTGDKSYDGHDYDPRLLSECSHCHKPPRFNPFIVDTGTGAEKAEYRIRKSEERE